MVKLEDSRERVVPALMSYDVRELQAHYARYLFALPWCVNQSVLDAACGVGFGTQLISNVAKAARGIDRCKEAVDYGWEKYGNERMFLLYGDVENMPFEDAQYDTVVSFETIEHLHHPVTFLRECSRVLKPNGLLMVSSPKGSGSIFHVEEYDRDQLHDLLVEADFVPERYWCQGPTLDIVENGLPTWKCPTHIFLAVKG